jgi:predicted small lipoprotein YifL
MKQLLLMIAVVVLVGCGKKEPVQPSASNPEATKPEPTKGINQTSKVAIGTPIWEFETGSGVLSSPAIGSDGTVYVGGGDELYAIKTESLGPAKSPWPMRGQNARHTGRVMKK